MASKILVQLVTNLDSGIQKRKKKSKNGRCLYLEIHFNVARFGASGYILNIKSTCLY